MMKLKLILFIQLLLLYYNSEGYLCHILPKSSRSILPKSSRSILSISSSKYQKKNHRLVTLSLLSKVPEIGENEGNYVIT